MHDHQSYLDLKSEPVALTPMSPTEFYVESRYGTRMAFTLGAEGKATAATSPLAVALRRHERLGAFLPPYL